MDIGIGDGVEVSTGREVGAETGMLGIADSSEVVVGGGTSEERSFTTVDCSSLACVSQDERIPKRSCKDYTSLIK